jgi:hypothetical protein
LNTDLSVAPEIAQLADPFVPPQLVTVAPRTAGRIAGTLTELAATPQRWWDLVRFDPDAPVRLQVPGVPGAWLLVLPPGVTVDCDCLQATALAGEATEAAVRPALGGTALGSPAIASTAPASATAQASPLRPGRVRVHGAGMPHRLRAAGPGYSVTLHMGDTRPHSA